ncbi:hypothetical protein [Pseudomonas urmiensis]|uniref:hypothetical protein n=1 Tax=Pseudomonas urmiensis TaxID=2745493 RepID=UPI0034D69E31
MANFWKIRLPLHPWEDIDMSMSPPEALVAWMGKNPSMLNWDMIASQPLSLLQYTVQQQELQRLAEQTVAFISGQALRQEDDSLHELDNYIVRLTDVQIKANGYERPMLRVQLSLEGGSYVKSSYLGEVMSIAVHDSVSRLQATMNLPVRLENGQVVLDLGQGQDHTLVLNSTADLESLGPKMLKAGLDALEPAQQVLALADVISSEDNPFRQVSRALPAVQGSDGLAPALLFFVNFTHGGQGGMPQDGLDFPSLLANSADDRYASTAILSWRLLHRDAYAQSILGVLQGGEYRYVQSDPPEKGLDSMEALKGQLSIPVGRCEGLGLEVLFDEIVVPGSGGKAALKIAFAEGRISQTWQPSCTVGYRYRRVGATEQWTSSQITLEPRLDYAFELAVDARAGLTGRLDSMVKQAAASIDDQSVPPSTHDDAIKALADYAVRRGFLNALSTRLTAHIDSQILPCLRQPDGRFIQPLVRNRTNNLLLMGGFKSTYSSFRIVEQNVELSAAAETTFTVEPPSNGVKWSIEPLPGTTGEMGEINEATGHYQAPSAAALGGKKLMVRVVAKRAGAEERSESLVMVIGHSLDFNPKFATCFSGTSLQLRADLLEGSSMAAEELEWQVLTDGAGSGTISSSGAGSLIADYLAAPAPGDVRYVIDQIQVTGKTSGRTATGYVLVTHKEPDLHLSVDEQWTGAGLKIQARVQGSTTPLEVEWILPLAGTGQIDSTGVYTPQGDARFVVILAKKQTSTKTYEGSLTLPLPLSSFAELRKTQIARATLKWEAKDEEGV